MRILALITDAYGGYGGIALYNRDFLSALCLHPNVTEVVAVPRVISCEMKDLPDKLTYITSSTQGKLAYIKSVYKQATSSRPFDLIVCGHIHLMPIAWLLKKKLNLPVILEIYGIEAWQPPKRWFKKMALSADTIISISQYTKDKYLKWSKTPEQQCKLLPNAIHLEQYGEAEPSHILLQRYNLADKTVILTLGRLVSHERAKGFDEIIELVPELLKEIPDLVYVIAGKGDYKIQLEEKARALNITQHIVFTGMIAESEKADLYRIADLYVMPSQGEGFGFVFLEALACGTPVVASKSDGSRDAIRDGMLGIMVDPNNPQEIKQGILKGLSVKKGIPEGLQYFAFPNFTQRLHLIINEITTNP